MFVLLLVKLVSSADSPNLYTGQGNDEIVVGIEQMSKAGPWLIGAVTYGLYCEKDAKCTCETAFFGGTWGILGSHGPGYGLLEVDVDGFVYTLDYSDGSGKDHVKDGLYLALGGDGYHTIKITQVTGKIKIDGIIFKPSATMKKVKDTQLNFNSNWEVPAGLGSHYTKDQGFFNYKFTGNLLIINGSIGPDFGIAYLWFDNEPRITINASSQRKSMSALLYMKELKNGTHDITMQGAKDIGFGISGFFIRDFYIYKQLDSPPFVMSTGWAVSGSNPKHWYTETDNSDWTKNYQFANITIKCTKFTIVAVKSSQKGLMEVDVNRTKVAMVDTYSTDTELMVNVFSYAVPYGLNGIQFIRMKQADQYRNNALDVYGIWFYDNMGAGLLEFRVSTIETEIGNDVTLVIDRIGGQIGPTNAKIEFIDENAANGVNYVAKNQTIHFNGGQKSAKIDVKTNHLNSNSPASLKFKCNIISVEHFVIIGQKQSVEVVLKYIPPTPTSMFTRSNDFTASSKFTSSSIFAQTSKFSLTPKFIETDQYTSSVKFSSSFKFSFTSKFSETGQYTSSHKLSTSSFFKESKKFSSSLKFGQTNKFSITSEFDKTDTFGKTKKFTTSLIFPISIEFSHSNKYSASIIHKNFHGLLVH